MFVCSCHACGSCLVIVCQYCSEPSNRHNKIDNGFLDRRIETLGICCRGFPFQLCQQEKSSQWTWSHPQQVHVLVSNMINYVSMILARHSKALTVMRLKRLALKPHLERWIPWSLGQHRVRFLFYIIIYKCKLKKKKKTSLKSYLKCMKGGDGVLFF